MEQLLYLIFGALTTAVDWGVSFLLYYIWGDAIAESAVLVHAVNVIAWIAAVAFSYITNRIFVFKSTQTGFFPILTEILAFAGGRIVTLLLQELMFLIFFHFIGLETYLVKIIASVLVVVANYFISKLLVFRKQKDKKSKNL